MGLAYVVTGAGRGVGRAIAERLAGRGHVIALDRDAVALRWTADRPTVDGLAGDATDEQILTTAVERASVRTVTFDPGSIPRIVVAGCAVARGKRGAHTLRVLRDRRRRARRRLRPERARRKRLEADPHVTRSCG